MKEKVGISISQALSSCQKNQILGMNQKDWIVLLFNAAADLLRQAQKFLSERKPAEFSDSLERIRRIIYHLYDSLDIDQGGENAEHLGALYTYIIGQLYIVNSTKNDKIISDLLVIINNLKEGWEGLNPQELSKGTFKHGAMPAGKRTVVSTKV
ncbi:MAG TPA: flagellar protein FliS [candidate division Zixibacteria bacterium]|nr:flagellar protein FliS [candidate division Zixibacteria bacterium]HEQ98686.1 flagellar protein FliS [candidate division Zixibacteria bacterium]